MENEATNMPITFEKARLNVWNLGGFIITIIVAAFGWGITYNSMTTADAAAVREIANLSNDVSDIQKQMPQIATLQFQMTRATEQIAENKATSETEIKATNARIDRLVETFGGKIDLLTDSVNKLVTRVEVLSTRIGNSGSDPQKTRFLTK